MERWFYTNYIKKLRISQYLIRDRINSVRLKKENHSIQVTKEFLIINGLEIVKEKEFKVYLDKFFPQDLTVSVILK